MLKTLGTPNSNLGVSHEVNLPRVLSWDVVMIQPIWGPTNLGVPGDRPALTCIGIWCLGCCHTSTYSGICQSSSPRRSTCLDLPRDPILWRLTCLNLPGDLISRRLSCLSLSGDLHPNPGMPSSQVATVLGRVSFRKTHP